MTKQELRKKLERLDRCELKLVLDFVRCLQRKEDAKARRAAEKAATRGKR